MIENGQTYKCGTCGNMVTVVEVGGGELVCCSQPMKLMPIQKEGDKAAKHVPIIENDGSAVLVKVGELQHPMDEDHYIAAIALQVGDKTFIKNLEPGELPEAKFIVDEKDLADNDIVAREFCTLHGIWES